MAGDIEVPVVRCDGRTISAEEILNMVDFTNEQFDFPGVAFDIPEPVVFFPVIWPTNSSQDEQIERAARAFELQKLRLSLIAAVALRRGGGGFLSVEIAKSVDTPEAVSGRVFVAIAAAQWVRGRMPFGADDGRPDLAAGPDSSSYTVEFARLGSWRMTQRVGCSPCLAQYEDEMRNRGWHDGAIVIASTDGFILPWDASTTQE
jgi:hypothetical protein